MNRVEGGVTAPKGYRAAGTAAGIKPGSTKRDCALIASDVQASVAGAFTTNQFKAAPVLWCAEVCAGGRAQAAFINSGNANACTGEQGCDDARTTAEWVGRGLGVAPDEVCVCSTGVIGVPLPMDRIEHGVQSCLEALSTTGGAEAAEAIMTTDTVPKEAAVEVVLGQGTVRLGAIAKGAGMIAPNLATMVCVITTDAAIGPGPLANLLRAAVSESFNRICVDNDTSTNDTVLCLANGQADVSSLAPGTDDFDQFGRALTALCQDMAKRLVRDGEGATKFVEIEVSGAQSDADAGQIARSIATSQLCKTAFFGQDPNWGRFACAAGYAGIPFAPDAFALWVEDVQLVKNGRAADYEEAAAAACMRKSEFCIRVRVGDGPGAAVFWTSDLSHDYVTINADYRT